MPEEFRTVYWHNDRVRMVDQTKLPLIEEWLDLDDYHLVGIAIKTMQVRGAPAIGVTAALGLALAANASAAATTGELIADIESGGIELGATRPTAVNLFWAIKRMIGFAKANSRLSVDGLKDALVREAVAIAEEDVSRNRALGKYGAALIEDGDNILTHCNAGALACAGYGTALGVIRAAWESGKKIHVYVDETRPLLQGARLTAWELTREGIPMTLITDNMAGHIMRLGKIQRVVVGADRIAANGDTANKIGTYTVATMAAAHGIPFYVAAPTSTIDLTLADGGSIPIEERSPDEVTGYGDYKWTPPGVAAANPAFDITPNSLIGAIITELGVVRPPFSDTFKSTLSAATILGA